MYGYPQPVMPHGGMQWNRPRPPINPQWRPFLAPRVRVPHYRPRHQGFCNQRPYVEPGSEEHWCETCDRGFHTEDLLSKHKQQHQKCNIDGCQFIAHPKVITKHIQMQHSSGLYKKIAKLNNPEEIEKWKEERRRRYPTKTNIDKKAAEMKEKIDRGETIGLGRRDWRGHGGKKVNEDYNTESAQGIKRRNYNQNQTKTKSRKPINRKPRRPPNTLPEAEINRKLAPFAGIQSIEMDCEEVDENVCCNYLIEDDDIETLNADATIAANIDDTLMVTPVVCGALSSLICEYGSSDEEIENTSTTYNKTDTKNGDYAKNTIESKSYLDNKETKNNQNNKPNNDIKQNTPQKLSNPNVIDNAPLVVEKNLEKDNNYAASGVENQGKGIIKQEVLQINNPVTNNAIGSRLNDCSEKQMISDLNKKDVVSTKDDDDDDSGPEEVKLDRNGQSANNDTQKSKDNTIIAKTKVEAMRKKPCYRKPKPKLPSTLIYRLLSKEMKQERNKVLQCIRYIRKNNYFDKDTK